MNTLEARLQQALDARGERLTGPHNAAWRAFAGFYEGEPRLVVDIYARTLVLFDYGATDDLLRAVKNFYLERIPWLNCVIHKPRRAAEPARRRGMIAWGETPAAEVREYDVRYALDLLMQQDASFYLDTRELRRWLLQNAAGWHVLNTFAYTGSLGVAALAGGAAHVLQTDRSKTFLALARRSAILNRLDLGRMKLRAGDFFSQIAYLKRRGVLFDCVILDPPFFSRTDKGRVDMVNESVRLINKVRPLVCDGGWLIAINNALFVSGAEYLRSLEKLCADGYLSLDELIPVPLDITGYPESILNVPPADPAPFNHPTKIAVLRVRRKH